MFIKTLWQYFKFLVRGSATPDIASFDFIRPGMLVFDIGANRGNYSRLFLSKGARVIAVEPQKDCISFLKIRFAFFKKITLVDAGAGATIGPQTFFISNADSISSMNRSWIDKVKASQRFSAWNVEWKKSITVQLTTLDRLIEQHGLPAYIKIDVEGFEKEVLKGLTQPVATISFEYTLPEMKEDALECVNYLAALGNYSFKSQVNSNGALVSRDEIVAEINSMSASGVLHNGDIFATRK